MSVIFNKKAGFDYEILDKTETGIVLDGAEVKSIVNGAASLNDSFVKILDNELWLINANIHKYPYSNNKEYDPLRTRKLLAKKGEIIKLASKMKQGNLTLVPLKFYFAHKRIKVEIGLAKGKKHYEKKLREKERDLARETHREGRKLVV
jgi:SsrA-binding protein